jgi:hypothetical protein
MAWLQNMFGWLLLLATCIKGVLRHVICAAELDVALGTVMYHLSAPVPQVITLRIF